MLYFANFTHGKEYRSGNASYLMMMGMKKFGWSSKCISFVETNKMGGNLKGQKSAKIEVPFLVKKEVDKTTGLTRKCCAVSARPQCSTLIRSMVSSLRKRPRKLDRVGWKRLDRILAKLQEQSELCRAHLTIGGCWYLPAEDKIGMPRREAFADTYEFYSSLCREMAHATP